MDSTTRLDSAATLARSPLFARLGRLDLCRLAGELEELHFTPGQVIVREGEAADGFYVINSGRVTVIAGASSADGGSPVTELEEGEGFGEMALLTDSPRTATVVAQSDVTLWRLSRVRFDTLLGHERSIAQTIERTLSERLAVTTQEIAALRSVAQALATRALSALSPAAGRLMSALLLHAEWPAAALASACERTGTAAALAELDALPGFLRRQGASAHVDPTFAGLIGRRAEAIDPEWCEMAADELAAAGDVVGAIHLDFAAGRLARVARRLVDGEAALLESARPRDVERWVEQVGAADSFLTERLRALGARLGRAAEAPAGGAGAGAPIRTHRLRLRFPGAKLIGALSALLVLVLGYVLPTPGGLSRPGLAALGAIVATVPLLVCGVLPDYVVMLLLTLALVLPGHVPASAMLGGFATPAWIMILTLLAVGTAVSRSGLMLRLVLVSLQRLPPTFLAQSLALSWTGILMTAGLTSGATRIALGVPIARGIADAMGFARRSPGAAAIGLLTFFTFLEMGELFLTGTFTGLVVHDLLPRAARSTITWWRWSLVALPTFVVIFGLVYAMLLLLFQPHRQARVNLGAIQLQQSLLGPLTRHEIWSAVALAVLLVGFATREVHGIAPAWLSVAVFLGLFMLGTMDQTALQGGGILGLLVYSGVILSLSNVFGALEIDAWLTSLVQTGMPATVRNPYGFVFVIALIAFALHFFVPWMTATTLIALVTMPLADGLGFHPFIPVFVALVAGDHTIVPYVNSGYAILYFASEGELFSHAQARWPLVLETVFRMVALLASVPVWHLMGLM